MQRAIAVRVGPLTEGNLVDFIHFYSANQPEPLTQAEKEELLYALFDWRERLVPAASGAL